MSHSPNAFATTMKTLHLPTVPRGGGEGTETRLRVNSHIHLPPNFSAFETTAQAMELAGEQDIRVLGVSNYYDYSVYDDFAGRAKDMGIFPLFGLEIITLIDDLVREGVKINDPGNPGKMYICGKGITRWDPMSDTARKLLQTIRDNDSERMRAVVDKLASVFAARGVPVALDTAAIKARIVTRHGSPPETVYLQERHVAQAFQEVLFATIPQDEQAGALERVFGTASKAGPDDAVGVQNEIRSHLLKAGKPAFVPETFVDFDHAYELILALGGIPCYPTLADGVSPICPFEEPVEKLAANLKERGVYCAEFIPIRNTPEVLSHYVQSMRDAGLFVTAGTEHNTLDLIALEPTCLNGDAIPEDIKDIFWEGACV
ncbi:MAG: hypothetical protein M3Y56_09075, partial [Armatimonadota bacterium]|nr:hypothetical protein [Armatimonadota bacterium]